MCFFTDYIPLKSAQYDMGWSMILCMVLMMTVNLLVVILDGVRNIYLLSLKYGRFLTTTALFKKLIKCFKKDAETITVPPPIEIVELVVRTDQRPVLVPALVPAVVTNTENKLINDSMEETHEEVIN